MEDEMMNVVRCRYLFEQLHELCALAGPLVVADEILEVVRVDDNMQPAYVRKTDLVCFETRKAYFLPGGDTVCLGCCLHRFSVLLQVNVAKSQLGVVVDVYEEDLRSLEHTLVIAPLA